MTRRGKMVEIRCPDCARAGVAGIALRVPSRLRYAVAPAETVADGEAHACGRCTSCGREWCAITERRGEARKVA